jgi:cytohesin
MAFGFMTPLHLAFTRQRDEMAGWLLDYGANPFLEKGFVNDKTTPFELDITRSDGKLVPRMLTDGPKYFAEPNAIGNASPTPARRTLDGFLTNRGPALLSIAAQRGELEAVQALLKAGVSAIAGPSDERPLLQTFAVAEAAAARADHFDPDRWRQIRQLLIANGAVYDAFAATARGDLEQARRLAEADKNLAQSRDRDGQTPLHWAVQYNQLPLTAFWLQAGAPPSATNSAGQTALHIAAANNLIEHARALLAALAPTDVRDTNGWTPLDAAIHAQQTDAIRLLLSDKGTSPQSDRAIALPIHQAAASGNLDALIPLAEATNNLEARDELGLTPLQIAVTHGHLAAAALLVDSGANVNVRDADGNTLLHRIILHDRGWTVYDRPPTNWLTRLGQDPRKSVYAKYLTVGQYEQGPNPLLQGASFLLACGLDARATNRAGRTAIQLVTDANASGGMFFFNDDLAELLKLLGSGGGNLNAGDAEGNTPLHLAGQSTFIDPIVNLLAAGADINATNHKGQTPLHKFAENITSWGESDDATNSPFQLLLKNKPNVNAQDNDGLTPLHVLALSSNSFMRVQATRLLLAAGADPNLRDKKGRTPVHCFLLGQWPWSDARECIELMVKAGAGLSAKDNEGKTPLFYLAAVGGPEILLPAIPGLDDPLRATKTDIHLRDRNGDTPLHIAARIGTRDVFEWLVKEGADMDATNNAGETPRLLSARSAPASHGGGEGPATSASDILQLANAGNVEAVKKLLESDRKLANQTDLFGRTPLLLALMAHHTNMVELLEEYGAPWDGESAVVAGRVDKLREILRERPEAAMTETSSGWYLLHLAAGGGNLEIIKTLLEAKADAQAADPSGLSPLGHALLGKQTDAASLLLQHGAKENLFDAIYTGDEKTASALLAQDKSLVFITNRAGSSVVETAAQRTKTDMLVLLLDKGAPVDATNAQSGITPLHAAALSNLTNAARVLIQHGAKVQARDLAGFTPLLRAATLGSTEMAALLLENNASPDASVVSPINPGMPMPGRTAAGNTALHFAALRGDTNLIQLLLKAGASVNPANAAGMTPLDLATQPGLGIMRPGMFGPGILQTQQGAVISRGPSRPGGPAAANPIAALRERQTVAATLLEAAGGKHSTPNR